MHCSNGTNTGFLWSSNLKSPHLQPLRLKGSTTIRTYYVNCKYYIRKLLHKIGPKIAPNKTSSRELGSWNNAAWSCGYQPRLKSKSSHTQPKNRAMAAVRERRHGRGWDLFQDCVVDEIQEKIYLWKAEPIVTRPNSSLHS